MTRLEENQGAGSSRHLSRAAEERQRGKELSALRASRAQGSREGRGQGGHVHLCAL